MAVRVYQIGFDADRYQALYVDSDDKTVRAGVRLEGERRANTWSPPRVYPDHLNLEVPDIWKLIGSDSIVLSPKAREALRDVLLEAELLPLAVGDETFTVVNVVEVRNYLDAEQTKWFAGIEGVIAEVPQFAVHRIGGASLFKLPNDKHVWLYCWEDDDDPSDSFRHVVFAEGLTGLIFEEVWNSETGGRRPSSVPGG